MRLFISEYITGGGLAHDPLPESLKQEGLMMLKALVHDCQQIDNCEITLTMDSRIQCKFERVDIIQVDHNSNYIDILQKHAVKHDKTWVIAPESEGVLADIIEFLAQQKVTTVNSNLESIRACSDKQLCDSHLTNHGVNTIARLADHELQNYQEAVIVKRRDGAGCEDMKKCPSGLAALEYMSGFDMCAEAWYVQPYIEGEHKSLSLICINGKAKVLSCNTQVISFEGAVQLISCITNDGVIGEDIEALANDIASAFPGLKGYVGVDLLENHTGRYVIDVNPRLTSSYVGLKQCLIDNPAQLCVQLCETDRLPRQIQRSKNKVEVKIVS
jgi:predicted ATP-grasp superfamily ATP-dependent carboligase